MINLRTFLQIVTSRNGLNRPIDQDSGQIAAVQAGAAESLYLIAGPGSGKTTVLTLRVLKLIFVDGIDPQAIVATTFTKKAAAELRSRILGWGDSIRGLLILDAQRAQDAALLTSLQTLDLNKVVTGTIDSLSQQLTTDFREPGTQPVIPIEEFVANALMQRSGLWPNRRDDNPDFRNYIQSLRVSTLPVNQRHLIQSCREIRDRIIHDGVDRTSYIAANSGRQPGVQILQQVLDDYEDRLAREFVVDFASLEQEFFNRLTSGTLSRFTQTIKILLVDEYQDTNWLQEQIYFSMARTAVAAGGSVVVVGDDDQSLYRFRGATVELFADFTNRVWATCSVRPLTIFLSNNYRSTSNIVQFCNQFVALDSQYGRARVTGKPSLGTQRLPNYSNTPIIGLFRPDVATLATELTGIIDDVFNGIGFTVTWNGQSYQVVKDPLTGALGDCVLLSSSPAEYSSGRNPRLPLLLRRNLQSLRSPVMVFNPRGREYAEIREVQLLCGLMLECIDPAGTIQSSVPGFPRNIAPTFDNWRAVARQFINSNPNSPGAPRLGNSLLEFVSAWQTRTPQGSGNWPREVSLIQLMYQLVAWIPQLQADSEGLVYLELITRTISQSTRVIAYDGTVQRDEPARSESVRAILWGIFEPLASGAIDLDEDLIETWPRDRLNIMSIHQSKGLEFPMVIVDVGSDFNRNHAAQAFKRFPRSGAGSQNMEDQFRPYSPLQAPVRPAVDRAFDDLIRALC